MNATVTPPVLRLRARVAEDLMMRNPVSLRADATIDEAMTLFVDKGIDAAPVIDDGGRPIGVISRSDVFVHLLEDARRRKHPHPSAVAEGAEAASRVSDLMTPTVFAVGLHTLAAKIVTDMVGLHVHRLFVVDDDGVLVGVVTAMDVLKCVQA
jgi:CBS domain-containing protein